MSFLILQVYLSLCCALVASAVGAYLHLLWNIGGLLTTFACFGNIMWLLSTPSYEEVFLLYFSSTPISLVASKYFSLL